MGRYAVAGLTLLSIAACAKRSDDSASSRYASSTGQSELQASPRHEEGGPEEHQKTPRERARAQGGSPLLPPLRAEEDIIALPVSGFEDAYVSVPTLATAPRPVIVAAHGAGDRPDSQCRAWRDVVGDRAFVVCPAGRPMQGPADSRGFVWSDASAIGREKDAALDALEGKFAGYVQRASPVYAGFSQGAILGVPLVAKSAADHPRIVLIEGGWGGWQIATARSFGKLGGERVLFVCGQKNCLQGANASQKTLERAGVQARVVGLESAGHTYGGAVHDAVKEAFPWVVEGLPGWQ